MIQADTVTREGAEERGGSTKTSVTIPDELLIEAKALTVTQKTSVQDLLISGLRRELAARKVTHSEGGNAASGSSPASRQATRKTSVRSNTREPPQSNKHRDWAT